MAGIMMPAGGAPAPIIRPVNSAPWGVMTPKAPTTAPVVGTGAHEFTNMPYAMARHTTQSVL